jgi:hypothetical protein
MEQRFRSTGFAFLAPFAVNSPVDPKKILDFNSNA